MSHNYDKIVKLACKPKNAPPKAKYIDVLIAASFSDDGSLQDIIRSLSLRLREANAVVVFKALLTLHQMIRSGGTQQLLEALSRQDVLKLRNVQGNSWEGFTPPASMSAYAAYLDSRIRSFKEIKHDLVRAQAESNRRSDGLGAASKARRLRHLPVEKGLLREVKQVQKILDTLIQCKFFDDDLRDENTVLAFRMLIKDLLVLFQAGNEGVCNILEHYFEMSKVDATDAFDIYKSFIKQTDRVVDYLGIARKLHHVVNVPVPNLKHAPTGLVKALEEYLNDPNFETNRIEYKKSLGVVEGKNTGRDPSPAARNPSPAKESKPASASSSSAPAPNPPASPPPAQAPPGASQKIQDFFESIQSNQQPTMFGGPAQQNYSQMTIGQAAFNPFRQSMMMPQQTGFMQPQMTGFPMQQQGFLQPQATGAMAFGHQGQSVFQPQQQQQNNGPFIQPQQTGFMQPQPQQQIPQQTGFLQPQATGANPFRQSMMLNTSMGPSGAMSQPSSPFGHNPLHGTGGTGSQNAGVNGFGQILRPGSTPALGTTGSSEPKPLVAQPTGSKNPFAPVGGVPPPVPQQNKGPTMNDLLMGGINTQPTGVGAGSPWGGQQQQSQQPFGQTQQQINGNASGGAGAGGSGAMSDIASAFTFDGSKSQSQNGGNSNNDFLSQFGSGTVSLNGSSTNNNTASSPSSGTNAFSQFGSLSSQPTGATSLSSQSTGFLQPQQTGFGGSGIKPFKPTSSFGSQLLESLPPIHEPGSTNSAETPGPGTTMSQSPLGAGGVQPQSTGFPGFGGGNVGGAGGIGSLSPQMTGANPFRQSTFGSLSSQPTGFGGGAGGGAFGAGTPFAGQNRPPGQQGGGMGQFGMFGGQPQGQQQGQQNQGGSLI
ncbi:ENTH domain-containing protein [Kwoniella heveanensis CBS 569]|uniref:ENTH domain-containing protein n=1 Tax=Kwoniella heveanensis BCC8398 TaxID=1296120 RepID=A0A1B9GKM3_9TREE|nr:ENTH domain-containing protein [Kwoniella heveanensis BCC8398]OCF44552.1 ENTH domain-containing protein [Kwoniella heveanensis CBS 569]